MQILRSIKKPHLRVVIGIIVSAASAAIALASVELDLLVAAATEIDLALACVAIVLSTVEVGVRAERWRLLLRPMAHLSLVSAYGLLAVGHLLNAVMPARLGDLARIVITGRRYGVSKASILGTVAVERGADVSVLGLALVVAGSAGYNAPDPYLAFITAISLVAVAVLMWTLSSHSAVATSRLLAAARGYLQRFAAGGRSLLDPRLAVQVLLMTVASFALAVAIMLTGAQAAGLEMPPWQAALVIAAVTLSTAIPAGPASIGPYELIGLAVLTSLGHPPAPSLLAVATVHAVAVLTPASVGLAALWSMRVEPIWKQHHEPSSVDDR